MQVGNTCEQANQDKLACFNLAGSGTLPGGVLAQEYRYQGNVADGSKFCIEAPGTTAGKGCTVTFSRDAYLDYGGGNSVTEGRISMSPDSNVVDQSCTLGEGQNPKPAPPREKCPNGYSGMVNGVDTCVNRVPDSGADGGDKTESEEDNGTETRRVTTDKNTTCKNGVCTTVTTVTTTITNNSTGASSSSTSTSTTTKPQAGFCQENPRSKLCSDGDEKGSSFGGTCSAGFTCEGDAIQCAIAQEQHRRACKLFDDVDSQEYKLYQQEKSKTGKRTGDLPGNETISFGSGRYDSSNMLGAGSCISDLTVDIMGKNVVLPLSNICPMLATLRLALLAFGALLWVIIVFRG
ncbi:hypothetical protein ACIGHN_11535 [Acidovorax sp. NPDC077693]|uniref:hypothetical protein n=1 Tax=unclassified Acidovorax TaxID=2684926 RepID=UPI0037CA917B